MPYETDQPLPAGVYGGWFKLENNEIVEYTELNPSEQEKMLKQRLESLETENADLCFQILNNETRESVV
ncbi:hypothetical protein [Gracilibacillus ureilyticus]|uniref:hypothetical protein n=1 Tax=Gracilibacillus ureilyticus TaxID=531814 RepID=UPI000B7FE886|nr:hypothetical protein [Gracilibacillus ureilyticus]